MKFLIVALLLSSAPAYGQVSESEAGAAQSAMLKRVEKSVNSFLSANKLNAMYASYCQTQMLIDTSKAPPGSIPFGVNYKSIPNNDTLEMIIYSREAYETAYLKLCLSRALKTLDSVNPFNKFDGFGE